MGVEVVTLTQLLGEPDFLAPQKMNAEAEREVMAHVRSRRQADFFPITTDDLTTLLERRADELDLYADLSQYGNGVEGLTIFRVGQAPSVKVAGHLSEAANENRLRSTLAHEFGHVFAHDPMFQRRAQERLFEDGPDALQVCYRDGEGRPATDLYEFQAWYLCGAILMPYSEIASIVSRVSVAAGTYTDIWQGSELGQRLIGHVSRIFAVSEALARIRLVKTSLLKPTEADPALF